MVLSRVPLAGLLGFGLVAVLLPAPPAGAAAPPDPTIGAVSVQDGSVSTEVVTPSPAVRLRIWLSNSPETTQTFSSTPHQTLTVTSELTPMTMATWGWTGEVYVWAQTCTTTAPAPSAGDCSARVRTAEPFAPLDPTPTITFSDDVTVGTGNLPTITVADNTGPLEAEWHTSTGYFRTYPLNTEGVTTLDLAQGIGEVTVRRCGPHRCRTFDPTFTQSYDVQRTLTATALSIPDISLDRPVTTARIRLDRPGTAQVEWTLSPATPAGSDPALTGTTEPAPVGPDGIVSVELSATQIPDGTYRFTAWVDLENEYGSFRRQAGPSGTPPGFFVDRVAPSVTSISTTARVIHPLTTAPSGYGTPGYADRTEITVNGTDQSVARLHIVSPAGALVRSFLTGVGGRRVWNGEDSQGAVVPPGQYRVYATDHVGNRDLDVSTLITVTGLKRSNKSWTKTVTAVTGLYDRYVGRCSKLRRPALRGWAGSFGYYANTRCKDLSPRASAISTMHRVTLPAATGYYRLQVVAYGGAARRGNRSQGRLIYLTNRDRLENRVALRPTLGLHPGQSLKDPRKYVWPGRRFYWIVAVSPQQRYEVKNFTIKVAYYVIS